MRRVTLLCGKQRHTISVRAVPATGHTLHVLLDNAAEPTVFEVRKVLYHVGQNGRSKAVELKVWRRSNVAPPSDVLTARFWTEIKWATGSRPPCIGESIRLHCNELANLPYLTVWDVIHDIDQVGKQQTVKVRVVDASTQRVFSDEAIRRACTEDAEFVPLFDIADLPQAGNSDGSIA